jgi:hypothetical protein
VSVTELQGASGRRLFSMAFEQPIDHRNPSGARFTQRLSLIHTSYESPVVLVTHGYHMSPSSNFRYEPTTIVSGNQLGVEHRFFGGSRPDPLDWTKLDIFQAASDHHRVAAAFRQIYRGHWLNTGHSKSGMAAVYHRRFFPGDVDGTIAYVAPQSFGKDDSRYVAFLDQVGTSVCRQRLRDYQRMVLEHRAGLAAYMAGVEDDSGQVATFEKLGAGRAFEHATLDLPFLFWQYQTASLCSSIPGAGATDAQLFTFLDRVADVDQYSDYDLDTYAGYFYQAAGQLGFPGVQIAHLTDLLQNGTIDVDDYSPQAVTFDPAAMMDVDTWVRTQGRTLMFIYGQDDPYTAGAFEVGAAVDSYRYVVTGENHSAVIADLPDTQESQVRAIVLRWVGLTMAAKSADVERAPLERHPK